MPGPNKPGVTRFTLSRNQTACLKFTLGSAVSTCLPNATVVSSVKIFGCQPSKKPNKGLPCYKDPRVSKAGTCSNGKYSVCVAAPKSCGLALPCYTVLVELADGQQHLMNVTSRNFVNATAGN